jgi:hypothetical protein
MSRRFTARANVLSGHASVRVRPQRADRALLARGLVLALVALPLVALVACIEEQTSVDNACPSEQNWPLVSQVLERRCGTLDCHGDPSRPLLLHGRNGKRLSSAGQVGESGTSPAEYAANRLSVCGVEPEKMSAVVAGEEDLLTLTVIRKPLLDEAHKGGRVFLQTSEGFLCFASWIEEDVDVDSCEAELALP